MRLRPSGRTWKRVVRKCSNCGKPGHQKRTCTNLTFKGGEVLKAKPPANGQPSEGQLALKLLGLLCENPTASKRAIEAFYLLDGKGD